MKRVFWGLVLLVLLAACGGGVPTLIPTADLTPDAGPGLDQSPRSTPNSGLPPTWTPAPTPEPATPTTAPAATDAAAGQETYTIQPGDTLAEIAERFGVTLDALAQVNNIADINRIEVGQVLVIPR
ncbi:MAG: LysM peptidoglycan-binding domain-containing protein [Chloroflexi bacterium]|nr:LysM peptidoglycan-binding domain-containing protein [Chloroflexota bacterium]MCI0576086.1 LysM peptidoglycan-binding domain-containing protein [Chloroflexota bacterium]MCI0647874.1 LysM peptidoglycan-binding domain-containing protein [Chloroflexota bacterium]MCI0727125.1 LysM peptidoglycan-binding domain-containing protein [Chloroflexota bacterium]